MEFLSAGIAARHCVEMKRTAPSNDARLPLMRHTAFLATLPRRAAMWCCNGRKRTATLSRGRRAGHALQQAFPMCSRRVQAARRNPQGRPVGTEIAEGGCRQGRRFNPQEIAMSEQNRNQQNSGQQGQRQSGSNQAQGNEQNRNQEQQSGQRSQNQGGQDGSQQRQQGGQQEGQQANRDEQNQQRRQESGNGQR
jgi:hypothetical protein